MYFVTFAKDNQQRLGVCESTKGPVLDLKAASEIYGGNGGMPTTVLDVVRAGEDTVKRSRQLFKEAQDVEDIWYQQSEVRLLAPITRPSKNIIAVGLNYGAHSLEFTGNETLPDFPPVFTKAPTSVIGPEEAIECHAELTEQLDYEAELGIVIGKQGRDIPASDAEEYVFGYTIINDVTSRDLQKRTGQWFLGKSLDTFCPMGPYLAHKSVIEWPVALDIKSRVNGEIRQSSNTRLLLFDIPRLIEHISQGLTLEPGDIIATGTPEGVGMGFDPPRFLKPGDVVEVEIERLGKLRSPVQ